MDQIPANQVPISGAPFYIASVIKIVVIFTIIMVLVALWTYVERRVCAFMQNRLGPNRVGPQGILQPAADGLKNFLKEETLPPFADRGLFILAPMLSFIPALLTFSVLPMASPLPTRWGLVSMAIADLPVGFLFILAVASLGVYGIALAGWASNNKYSLLGGLRASAQLISYEIAMGLAAVAVLVLAGNITPHEIIQRQHESSWYVAPLFIAFLIFLIASFAETNRLPFDMPEAEAELIAGYHTEYSAMKFSMFFIAEYANMLTASALLVTLFFGGWDIFPRLHFSEPPWTLGKTALTLAAFWIKTLFFYFLYIWVRWTLPRFRFDQLMDLGWKILLPTALGYVMVVAVASWALIETGIGLGSKGMLVLSGVNIILAGVLFFILDRGRVVGGASRRARPARGEVVSRLAPPERA
ncbi:MAG TPA: NADH-quinone oxidoreductase subunit NuoH [Gemmatimonadales bacterium]|jgi:NADH-quinone oxidoreductase subunit H